jgi:hypothetical protein
MTQMKPAVQVEPFPQMRRLALAPSVGLMRSIFELEDNP